MPKINRPDQGEEVWLSQSQIALAILEYINSHRLARVPVPWDTDTKLMANNNVFSAVVTIGPAVKDEK